MGLKRTAMIGVGAVTGARVFNGILRVGAYAVLALLLSPWEFGVAGAAIVVMELANALGNFGLNPAVLRKNKGFRKYVDGAATIRILTGIITTVVVFLLAPLIGDFFGDDHVTGAIRVISINFVLLSAGFGPGVIILKELRYTLHVIPGLVSGIVTSFGSIVLAFLGYSYWSLIYASVLGNLLALVALYCLQPYRIRFTLDRRRARYLLTYGSLLSLATLIGVTILNVDRFYIGHFFGSIDLGYYVVALTWGTLAVTSLGSIVTVVMLPIYSKIQDDIGRVRKTFIKTVEYLGLVVFPLSFLLLVLADGFLYHILGGGTDKWMSALVPLQILCVFGMMRALVEPLYNIYQVYNRIRTMVYINTVVLIVVLVGIYPFSSYFGRITGVALILTLSFVIFTALHYHFMTDIIDLRLSQVARALAPQFLASTIMVIVVLVMKHFISLSLVWLVVLGTTGLLVFLAVLYALTGGRVTVNIMDILDQFRKKRTRPS